MKIFLTGATGFVGSHVARALHEAGADLRLLVRDSSRTDLIDALPHDRVSVDLCDAMALRHAIAGCDFVFHVAADYRLWARDSAAMYRTNVEGTRAIIEAAQKAGARRVIYCSSVATMGHHHDDTPSDETTPVTLADMIGHYKRSKFLAEQEALKLAQQGAPVIMLNPTAPIGEQDIKPTPTGKSIILRFLRREFFNTYVHTRLNFVDVREVARGHVAAIERGRNGERYILGGENLTLKQMLDRLAAVTGLPSPRIKSPYALALASGAVNTFFSGTLLGREPFVSYDEVRMGHQNMWASSEKAVHDLGWRIVPIDDALRRACEWFVARGYAPAPPKLVRAEVGVPA